jgi:hypothetical protein
MQEGESYNSYIIFTSILMVLSMGYYIYKFWNQRTAVINNDIGFGPSVNNRGNRANSDNINSGFNSEAVINLIFLFNDSRTLLTVPKEVIIEDFINNSLKTRLGLNGQQMISLFFQGTRLLRNKRFADYRQLGNECVVQVFTVNASSGQNESQYNEDAGIYDNEAVSKYTLFTHIVIFIFFVVVIFTYKTEKDLFTKNSLIIFTLMSVIWLIQFSKCLAKIILFRKVL